MLDYKLVSRPGRRCRARRRGHRAGRSVLAVSAGVAVLCTGTAGVALAAARSMPGGGAAAQCEAVAGPASTPSSVPSPAQTPAIVPSSSAPVSPEVCVSVTPAATEAKPGATVPFTIQISPTGLLDEMTVQLSVTSSRPPSFPAPTFTSCGDGDGTPTCTVGVLQSGQTTELEAQVLVPSSPPDETATLSATVSWAVLGVIGAGSATGAATIGVTGSAPTPPVSTPPTSPSPGGGHTGSPSPGGRHTGSPSPGGGHTGTPSPGGGHPGSPSPGTHSGGRPHGPEPAGAGSHLGARLGALALNMMPLLTERGPAVDPVGLFPRIYPSPLPTGPGGARRDKAASHSYRARTVADVLPLTMRQVSVQVAGLIVLALGILITVVRVPLRRRRTTDVEK